jgi:hypothetical protein
MALIPFLSSLFSSIFGNPITKPRRKTEMKQHLLNKLQPTLPKKIVPRTHG